MDRWDYEAERCVHQQGKGRWTPRLVAGALICYALTGALALAMMADEAQTPVFVCGIGDMATMGSPPVGPELTLHLTEAVPAATRPAPAP